jgi:chromosome segregation protein
LRLTHLKLAGFKSFVDPTTIHLHGQRVGVVGPNGCGKSNVMESVRWVMGESSAKEMRADAMDAVIFNGSANRKPISRASVELIFDNSMGGASGEWNQYAEISVKRVIEREKGSSYYINNTAVRRRDVADLFLGTGLGGRGYAIIGQNTISRIVEAKPEELRVFLEEAAGISKYKERRRETEFRLRDTRENLTRVEDICRELQKQINKLSSQAVVTERFLELQTTLKFAEGQLWLLKKREAGIAWSKNKEQVEALINSLEAQTAALRSSESQLEITRQAHYAASEGINKAQANYYEANAEVANLENQVRQTQEARERMQLQQEQVAQNLAKNAQILDTLLQDLSAKNFELEQANELEQTSALTLEQLTKGLPDKDTALKQTTEALQHAQQTLSNTRQRIQIEQNNVQFLNQNLQEINQRTIKYTTELNNLSLPDASTFLQFENTINQEQANIATQEQTLKAVSTQESTMVSNITKLREAQTVAQRALNQAEAELNSLTKLQQSLNQESKLAGWLLDNGLNANKRIWQHVQIHAQWRVALEATLGARLNAIVTDKAIANQRPPSGLILGLPKVDQANDSLANQRATLLSQVTVKDSKLFGVLADWLTGVYLLEDGEPPLEAAHKLKAGESLVNAFGDIYTKNSIAYHGTQSALQGVLERQQQIASLETNIPSLTRQLAEATNNFTENEQSLSKIRLQLQSENHTLRQLTTNFHKQQLELSRLKQVHESAHNRQQTINNEIEAVKSKQQTLELDIQQKQISISQLMDSIAGLETIARDAQSKKQVAEETYFALRDDIQKAEKTHQEHHFNKKLIDNIINELNNKIKVNGDEKMSLTVKQSEAEETLKRIQMETLKENLIKAIELKHLQEAALAQARNTLAEQETALQDQERLRLQNEQQLHPLRDALEQSRLNEQESRIYFEQCQAGLNENGIDEQSLAHNLNDESKASDFQNKTMQLERQIENLGAVNMAAIQELTTEKERKTYLDSQVADLMQASQTLEDAIKKIDKETRGKLQATYEEANRNFNELFNVLFNGGQAKLELLGDEILDTGVQVFAQPPGKKNTTIQMLSGGEKALTATALVFALFRLNPAPFCLMDEVDAPLDDSNTERFCSLVRKMSDKTQFMFVSHNKIAMEMAQQLIGVTMQESGVSRIVDVDIDTALQMQAV